MPLLGLHFGVEANNVFLVPAGMGCDDDPEPIYPLRVWIKDDVVSRDRHAEKRAPYPDERL